MPMVASDKEDRMTEVSLGLDAKNLLSNELLQATLVAMQEIAVSDWKKSALDDVEGRERAYRSWLSASDFARNLTSIITSGEMATEQLETDRLETENTQREFDSPNELRDGLHLS